MFKKPIQAAESGENSEARVAIPLRDQLPYMVGELPERAPANPWPELPLSNRIFLGGAGACAVWLVLRLGGPVTANATHEALFPYTAGGKRETCLSNLRALQSALAMYAQDSGGMLPPMETKDNAGDRVTWVTLSRRYAGDGSFVCPSGPSIKAGTGMVSCAYALNPVLAGIKPSGADEPSKALLLADGGTRHDVSLLPALPTWPSFKPRSGTVQAPDPEAENLAFRHSGGASALYADGHADVVYRDGAWDSLAPWGGSAAARLSLSRISDHDPTSKILISLLKAGDTAGAADWYAGHRKILSAPADEVTQLWLASGGTSDSIEAAGWNLAQARTLAGDASAQSAMDQEMTRRCKLELDAANSAGNEPRVVCTELRLPVPRNWTMEDGSDTRYTRTRFRSGIKNLFISIEMGHRSTYSAPGPIDWTGTERELSRAPGTGYRRVRIGQGTLLGTPASIWEFEVTQPSGPRLRKLYVGTCRGWDTCVLSCVAPAPGFEAWRPAFVGFATQLHFQ